MKIFVSYNTSDGEKTATFDSFENFVAACCHGALFEFMQIHVYIEPVFSRRTTLYKGNADNLYNTFVV